MTEPPNDNPPAAQANPRRQSRPAPPAALFVHTLCLLGSAAWLLLADVCQAREVPGWQHVGMGPRLLNLRTPGGGEFTSGVNLPLALILGIVQGMATFARDSVAARVSAVLSFL